MNFKNELKTNIAKLLAGGIISLMTMVFAWIITPVKELVRVPHTLELLQVDFMAKQSDLLMALHRQRTIDSAMYVQIKELQAASKEYQREIGIVKSKVNAVAGEFPELHRRFADIEEAVSNQHYEVIIKPHSNTNNLNFSSIWQMKNH
jgi:hypothetical protein